MASPNEENLSIDDIIDRNNEIILDIVAEAIFLIANDDDDEKTASQQTRRPAKNRIVSLGTRCLCMTTLIITRYMTTNCLGDNFG